VSSTLGRVVTAVPVDFGVTAAFSYGCKTKTAAKTKTAIATAAAISKDGKKSGCLYRVKVQLFL
jgi:hypothetical protein